MTALRRGLLWLSVLVLALAICFAYGTYAHLSLPLRALPVACAALGGVGFLAHCTSKMNARKKGRLFRGMLLAELVLFACISLWFMHTYRFTPLYDADALFTGAQAWLSGDLTSRGGPTYDASTYFYYFPNNLGATLVLRCWLGIARGIDPYVASCLLNMLLSLGMLACTALSAKGLGGEDAGICALALLALTLPLWLSCAAFYTDFLSIAFPVAAFYFSLRFERHKKPWELVLFGLFCALGAMIKITVLILPIAVVLWKLLCKRWKLALALLLSAALLVFAGQLALEACVYPGQLDRRTASEMNTPVLHWVMMGLYGDGFYNPMDYEFTRSFPTSAEASSAVAKEIVHRVQRLGPAGFARHILRKMGYALSDGTLMLSDYYDDYPIAPQALQELLLPGGSTYPVWQTICGGVHMAMLALCLLLAVFAAWKDDRDSSGALHIAIFGLLVFLSLWEASRRYWINFLPLWIVSAALFPTVQIRAIMHSIKQRRDAS